MKRIKVILFCIITLSFSMIIPFSSFAAEADPKIIDYEQFLVNQYVSENQLVGVFEIPPSYSTFYVTYPTGETYKMTNGFTGNLKWDSPNPYIFDVYPLGNYYFDATDINDGAMVTYEYTFDNNGSNANGIEHGKLGFYFSFSSSARALGANDTLLNPNDMVTNMDSMTLYGEFFSRTFFHKPDGTKYFQPVVTVDLNAPSSVVGAGTRFPFRFKLERMLISFSLDNIEEEAAGNRLLSIILNGYKQQQEKSESNTENYDNFFSMVEDIKNNGAEVTFPSIDEINSVVDNFGEFITPGEMELYVGVFQPFYSSPFILILIFGSAVMALVSIILFGKR